MLITKIGVVGQGFVGSAVAKAFKQLDRSLSVDTYDKYFDARSTQTTEWMAKYCDVIFVCVPTPMDSSGACDTSIVDDVICKLDRAAKIRETGKRSAIVVIKSTVPPGTTEHMQARCENIELIFNPEFLNARTAYDDFINQDHVVLGGRSPNVCQIIGELFEELLQYTKIVVCDAKTAEMVKYVKNCFFAAKVSFMNEMYQMCSQLDVDYDEMIDIAKLDDRIGWEHLKVPGPSPGAGPWSGQLLPGWGGACFGKDVSAFRFLARQLGVDPKMMDATWEKNLEVRPQRDWEHIVGAVSTLKKIDDKDG